MTLSSAYIELFIQGKSPGGNVRGEMSGYRKLVMEQTLEVKAYVKRPPISLRQTMT